MENEKFVSKIKLGILYGIDSGHMAGRLVVNYIITLSMALVM